MCYNKKKEVLKLRLKKNRGKTTNTKYANRKNICEVKMEEILKQFIRQRAEQWVLIKTKEYEKQTGVIHSPPPIKINFNIKTICQF